MIAKKICFAEAIALIIILVINRIILGVPKSLLVNSAFSATLTIIFVSIILFHKIVAITKPIIVATTKLIVTSYKVTPI